MTAFSFGAETQDIDASTPWIAASDDNLILLQTSLQKLNIPITAADSNGLTFVHSAASYGSLETLRWLLSQDRINVNAMDIDGDTPLHHCDDVESARILIEEGHCDFTKENNEMKTARYIKEEEMKALINHEDSSDDDIESLRDLVNYLKKTENENKEISMEQ